MATLSVAGDKYSLPDGEVDRVKLELANLKPSGVVIIDLADEDGDPIWVRLPYEAPVAILGWDPPVPLTLPSFGP